MSKVVFVLFGGILFTSKWKYWQGCIRYIVNIDIFAFFSMGYFSFETASCPSTILLTSGMNSNTSLSCQTKHYLVNFQNYASTQNPYSYFPLNLRFWNSTQGRCFVFHNELTTYSSLPRSHLTFLLTPLNLFGFSGRI